MSFFATSVRLSCSKARNRALGVAVSPLTSFHFKSTWYAFSLTPLKSASILLSRHSLLLSKNLPSFLHDGPISSFISAKRPSMESNGGNAMLVPARPQNHVILANLPIIIIPRGNLSAEFGCSIGILVNL